MACPGCGKKLRVLAEHAGKPARCPLCNTIYTVPEEGQLQLSMLDPADRWQLKTPEGQVYGPVARETLEQWVREGRVSEDCRLLCEAEGVWHSAADVYPALGPFPPVKVTAAGFARGPNPAEGASSTASRGHIHIVNDHRGGMILALGILSWAIGCPIFGVMAWVMGSSDLRDMQRGIMDARGMGLTQAGQIIGMVHSIIMLLFLVVLVFIALATTIV